MTDGTLRPLLTAAYAVCLVALAWKLLQLRRAPWDPALRTVVLAVLWLLLTFAFVDHQAWVQATLGTYWGTLIGEVASQGFGVIIVSFFALADPSAPGGGPRMVRAQAAAAVATVVVQGILLAALPPALYGQTYRTAAVEHPAAIGYYSVGALYLLQAYALAAALAWRIARRSTGRTRHGLTATVVGLGICTLAAALRPVSLGIRAGGVSGSVIDDVVENGFLAGVVVFMLGAIFPGTVTRVAALRRWLRHLRVYPRMAELGDAMTAAFPDGELGRYPDARPARAWGRVHRRCSRRIVECRDGLVRMSPHLAALGVAGGETDVGRVGSALAAALAERAAGRAVSGPPIYLLPPAGPDPDSEIDTLMALSAALATARRRVAG